MATWTNVYSPVDRSGREESSSRGSPSAHCNKEAFAATSWHYLRLLLLGVMAQQAQDQKKGKQISGWGFTDTYVCRRSSLFPSKSSSISSSNGIVAMISRRMDEENGRKTQININLRGNCFIERKLK